MEDQDFLDDIDDLLYDIDVDGEAYVCFLKGLSFSYHFLSSFPFPFSRGNGPCFGAVPIFSDICTRRGRLPFMSGQANPLPSIGRVAPHAV